MVASLLIAACGISDTVDSEAAPTSVTEATTATTPPTTEAPTATTSPQTSEAPTTAPPPEPVTTVPELVPGAPCQLGSHPDCIDPAGEGRGTYLLHGADCMRDLGAIGLAEMCVDADGDGVAGYPDSG